MAEPGRKKKTIIEVSARFGIGVDGLSYTIEEFTPSQGWRPVQWHDTLVHAAEALLELTAKARIVEMLGAGVSKINEATVQRILSEVSEDARRIYERSKQHIDLYEL